MEINIISRNNGVGLSRDVAIITGLLESIGHSVTFSDFMTDKPTDKQFDVNIFIELVMPIWFKNARINTIIPNPEWYDNTWRQFLSKFDLIFCKTREAEGTFQKLGLKTSFISFTSEDRIFKEITKDDNRFFHLAGKSAQKSTEMILRTWEKNPALPQITIIQDPGKWKRRVTIKNVTLINDHIDDFTLKALQNTHGFHVCPSETEGFGHYIMEALSCNGIVITTNAPPMNELITQDRGILTAYVRRAPQRLAINYFINEQTLAAAIQEAMLLNSQQKADIRYRGRAFFESNDTFFRKTFLESFGTLK